MYFDKKKQFRGDKWGSTFKHYLVLDDTNPKNKRDLIEGYSKDQGIPEPHSKTYLLNKIVRLCMNYLLDGRAICATIVQRPDKTYGWDHAHPILELYKHDYKILSHELIENESIRDLKDLYDHIREGKQISELPKLRSETQGKAYTRQLEAHLTAKTFKTKEELIIYCRDKKEEGYEYGLLTDFYRRYCDKWFSEDK
ncbi:hypothetical protein QNI16_07165 [Cytophagaceae bacterium YF14B1]|uniref:Uncharacterized protein n=1 Tax=Xanthocytophaga flava TaxID=3048013 RepID=A0AAE3U7L9_9BACT|nr:hypothetical protein [Xanthocytophaga flavus]MDJ1480258.1 hypothetical protein [Xanthocytophaga flavus]